ncbi:MAG: DUF86 domain-containing protein [Ruminococcaceae bacterium]|nr:DUF86 domain-containing protein [Oscillospiraceae bacterium]
MDNVKNDVYYVKKILKDIKFIIDKTEGVTLEALEDNEVLCDSILFRLIQISENSGKLTVEFKQAHREIPWQAIKGMRNKIVHEYGDVKLDVIHQTVTEDIPKICELLEALLTV